MAEGHAASGSPVPPPRSSTSRDAFSVAYVVLASVLIGAGIFTIFLWITSFAWVDFVGVFLLAIGGLMLFSPRAGADRAL